MRVENRELRMVEPRTDATRFAHPQKYGGHVVRTNRGTENREPRIVICLQVYLRLFVFVLRKIRKQKKRIEFEIVVVDLQRSLFFVLI